MTDTKQLERNMQNIHAQNEHSSYCECIWCLEKDTQYVKTSDLAKRTTASTSGNAWAQLGKPIPSLMQPGKPCNPLSKFQCSLLVTEE